MSGHLFAPEATGGHAIHYQRHTFGFAFLTAVAWAILALLS